MARPLRVDELRDLEAVEAVRARWRELADEIGRPYTTPEWCLAFWEHHHRGSGSLLRILVVRDGEEVVGLLPLHAEQQGRAGDRRAHWVLGSGIGHRADPLAALDREEEVAAALARHLAGAPGPPTSLRFPAVDRDATWCEGMARGWPGGPARVVDLREVPAPVARLSHDGHEAWLASRSKNFRRSRSKARTRFERDGGTVRRSHTPEQLDADVDALLALHDERFAALGRPSHLSESHRASLRAAARGSFETGRCRLWVAEAAGEVVGAELLFLAGDRMSAYTGGSATAWAEHSLGFVLLTHAVEDAHATGLSWFDLGGGASPYKLRFADQDQPLRWAVLVPPGAASTPALARALGDKASERLRTEARERLTEAQLARLRALVRRS